MASVSSIARDRRAGLARRSACATPRRRSRGWCAGASRPRRSPARGRCSRVARLQRLERGGQLLARRARPQTLELGQRQRAIAAKSRLSMMLSSRAAESTGGASSPPSAPCPRSARPSTAPPAPPSRPRRRRASAPPSPRPRRRRRARRSTSRRCRRRSAAGSSLARRIRPAASSRRTRSRRRRRSAPPDHRAPAADRADPQRGLDGGVDLFDRGGCERRLLGAFVGRIAVDDLVGQSALVGRSASTSVGSSARRALVFSVGMAGRRRPPDARPAPRLLLLTFAHACPRVRPVPRQLDQPRRALPRWALRLDRR